MTLLAQKSMLVVGRPNPVLSQRPVRGVRRTPCPGHRRLVRNRRGHRPAPARRRRRGRRGPHAGRGHTAQGHVHRQRPAHPVRAQALAAEALSVLGGLAILVNNAGAARPYLVGSAAIPDQEWQDSLDVNFLSAVRLTSAALPALRESSSAAIVNVSSGGATPLPAPLLHYGAAKTALNAYTLGLAAELAPEGIRVNIVTPGRSAPRAATRSARHSPTPWAPRRRR
jgi:NAD(P)-dependent dehydrogenase (short-subunit alcohol dehydrogenase family)